MTASSLAPSPLAMPPRRPTSSTGATLGQRPRKSAGTLSGPLKSRPFAGLAPSLSRELPRCRPYPNDREKVAYPDDVDAFAALIHGAARAVADGRTPPRSYYRCAFGEHWHLTSWIADGGVRQYEPAPSAAWPRPELERQR